MKIKYLLILFIIFFTSCKKTEIVNKYHPSSGPFSFQDKSGIWEFYTSEGVLEQRYNYDSHSLMYYNPEVLENYTYWLKSDTTIHVLDRPPMPIGGYNLFMQNIGRQFHIPSDVRQSGTRWRFEFAINISSNGKLTTIRTLNEVPPSFEQEVLRVIETYPYDWIPASYKGQTVESEYQLALTIIIQ